MDIILLDYIDKVGDKHEVVKVKNGYGRNYLIPRGLASVASLGALSESRVAAEPNRRSPRAPLLAASADG